MIDTLNQAWAFALVGGCGLLAGMLIATLAAWRIAVRLIREERDEAQAELKKAIDARMYWEREAKRLRASLDGADDYRPTPQPVFPRPLTHRQS